MGRLEYVSPLLQNVVSVLVSIRVKLQVCTNMFFGILAQLLRILAWNIGTPRDKEITVCVFGPLRPELYCPSHMRRCL